MTPPSIEARDHAPTRPYSMEESRAAYQGSEVSGGIPAPGVPQTPMGQKASQSRPTGAGASQEDLEAYFRQVFDEFVQMKRACGEPVESMTFEKFAAKLRENRQQLIEKYGCKAVKFQVYIKDGKAALKATPVK